MLSGARLPTNWWGVACLASAHILRAEAGLEEYPSIPFGTRVMVVTEPPPRDKFLPRAEPATIFGPSSSVSRAFWVYQKGYVQAKTNVFPAGMDQEDLHWVKCNMNTWDSPDCPLPLPKPELYDASALIPTETPQGELRDRPPPAQPV